MATRRTAGHAIWTAQDAASLCSPYFGACRSETLLVLHLDHQRRLIRLALVRRERPAQIPLRPILTEAVRYAATGLILAYCRAHGSPEPWESDLTGAKALAEAAAGLGIALHDHLICAGGEWRSLRGLGLL